MFSGVALASLVPPARFSFFSACPSYVTCSSLLWAPSVQFMQGLKKYGWAWAVGGGLNVVIQQVNPLFGEV